ncbi:UDP-N-acetylglucosamine 1-carboxyvinyltransferase [Candidatus Saccharibacteria bacterium]|nr:UDP-N-acetylglucosamine 1-carboxyvinyltransferase [Candidatus Saccharibacteria bacterium]
MTKTIEYRIEIGKLISKARTDKGLTQTELAEKLGTSQSAINRIEKGKQNISLDMVGRISDVLNSNILSVNTDGSLNFRINGGKELSGTIEVNTSKNAAVGLLCASLLNSGKTTLKHLARIEEVFRIIEVLNSIGVKTRWINNGKDLEIIPPRELNLKSLDLEAARRTRSVIMLMGPLLHIFDNFRLPYAGGCNLGERTVEPHLKALEPFGLHVDSKSTSGFYKATVKTIDNTDKTITLIERGDTVTENALMAAARFPGRTIIRNASTNYMVQDVMFYLEKLGVKIETNGTTLTVHGQSKINKTIEYSPSEDPIEAMSFIAAGIVTKSEITVARAPIEFLAIELETLKLMNQKFTLSDEYLADNDRTRLVDITFHKSDLIAPPDKIHPMPFPGLNIDCLPFFAVIAATAKGRTLIHDWVYENRAIYLTELSKLNGKVTMVDAHRIYIEGPTNWRPADLVTPPALRPAVVILLAMLAAPGTSILRHIYSINRGYEDFAKRLSSLGADIETLTGL